jgi:hypothetical protein
MTAAAFRALALELPEAEESAHMGHPDFRVRGKIFATLGPKEAYGVVLLPPDRQKFFVDAAPEAFAPVAGGWGKGGATRVELKAARKPAVRAALLEAWRKRAPKRLTDESPPP